MLPVAWSCRDGHLPNSHSRALFGGVNHQDRAVRVRNAGRTDRAQEKSPKTTVTAPAYYKKRRMLAAFNQPGTG